MDPHGSIFGNISPLLLLLSNVQQLIMISKPDSVHRVQRFIGRLALVSIGVDRYMKWFSNLHRHFTFRTRIYCSPNTQSEPVILIYVHMIHLSVFSMHRCSVLRMRLQAHAYKLSGNVFKCVGLLLISYVLAHACQFIEQIAKEQKKIGRTQMVCIAIGL